MPRLITGMMYTAFAVLYTSHARRDQSELKNGRVAMYATMGYILPEYFRFPGYLSPTEETAARPPLGPRSGGAERAVSERLGNSPWTWEFHPLKLRLCMSRTL